MDIFSFLMLASLLTKEFLFFIRLKKFSFFLNTNVEVLCVVLLFTNLTKYELHIKQKIMANESQKSDYLSM